MILTSIVVLFLYPGLLFAVGASILYTFLVEGSTAARSLFQPMGKVYALWSGEGLLSIISIVLASAGLAFLPLPFHPTAPLNIGMLLMAWAGLEGSFLLAVLPSLLAGDPLVVRAAIRELQRGVAGRTVLWVALSASVLLQYSWQQGGSWHYSTLLFLLLVAITTIFAFPVAVGWGPFAPEISVTPGGIRRGLPSPIIRLMLMSRAVRHSALLIASLVAVLPLTLLPAWAGSVLLAAGFVVASSGIKRFDGFFPRLPLPAIMRFCWWRLVPPSIAIIFYVLVML